MHRCLRSSPNSMSAYSPDHSPHDNGIFSAFQDAYSKEFKKVKDGPLSRTHKPKAILEPICKTIFKSKKLRKIARNSILHQEKVLNKVLELNGDLTHV